MTVSKLQLFLVSLIGAIPGAFLAFLSVMAFLNFAGGSSMLLKATTGLLAAIGTFMPILSAMILLSGRGDGKTAKGDVAKTAAGKEVAQSDSASSTSDSRDSTDSVASGDSFELDSEEAFTLDEDVFAEEEPKAKGKAKKKK
jgi:hypothetical protein